MEKITFSLHFPRSKDEARTRNMSVDSGEPIEEMDAYMVHGSLWFCLEIFQK